VGPGIDSIQGKYALCLQDLPNARNGGHQFLMLVGAQRLEGFDSNLEAPTPPLLLPETSHNPIDHHDREIADAAEGIWKSEIGLQVGLERSRRNGLSGGHQHVKRIKKRFHLFLQNLPYAERAQIIRGRVLFVDVAGDLAQRVCQFAHPPGAN